MFLVWRNGTSALTSLLSHLDINKVDLQLPVRLDTDEHRGSTTGEDHLVREVGRLEDERERAFLVLSARNLFIESRDSQAP